MKKFKTVFFLCLILVSPNSAWELILHENDTLEPEFSTFINDTTFVLVCSNNREEAIPYDSWGRSYSIERLFFYSITINGNIVSYKEHWLKPSKFSKIEQDGIVFSARRTTEEHVKSDRYIESLYRMNSKGEILWEFSFDDDSFYNKIEILTADIVQNTIAISTVNNKHDDKHAFRITKLDKNGKLLSENEISGFPGQFSWMIGYTIEYIEILPDGYRLFMTEWWDSHDCETAAWVVRIDLEGNVLFSNRIAETELPCSGKIADNAYFCEAPNIIGKNSIVIDSLGNIYEDFWGEKIEVTYCLPTSDEGFAVLTFFSLTKGDLDSMLWKRDFSSLTENSELRTASGHSIIEKPGGGFIVFATGETPENSYWGNSQALWIFPVDSLANPEIEQLPKDAESHNIGRINCIPLDGCSSVNINSNHCFTVSRPLPDDYYYHPNMTKSYNKNPLLPYDAHRFTIFDISNIRSVEEIKNIYYRKIKDVLIVDSIAYISVQDQSWGGELSILDISNPESMFEFYKFKTRRKFYGLSVSESYAYTTDLNNVFKVIDVGSPDTAYVVGVDTTIGLLANRIVSNSSFAYIAAWEEGLRIYDVHNPTDPYETGRLNTPGSSVDIFIEGAFAYIADGYAGLRIINISNPSEPKDAGFYQTGEYFNSVYVESCFAYVTIADFGLRVIDISDPAMPFEAGYYATNGRPLDLAVRDMNVFIADYDSGLVILDSSPIGGLIIDIAQNDINETYTICAPLGAEIEIFDVEGNLIKSDTSQKSIDSPCRSSFYGSFTWQPDETLPSGVYLVRARVDGGAGEVKRVVYLK